MLHISKFSFICEFHESFILQKFAREKKCMLHTKTLTHEIHVNFKNFSPYSSAEWLTVIFLK